MTATKFSETERKKLYDPKPLKFYRPHLQTDPKTLIEKVSKLSLQQQSPHYSADDYRSLNSLKSLNATGLPAVKSTSSKQAPSKKYSNSGHDVSNQPAVRGRPSQCWRLSLYSIQSKDSQLCAKSPAREVWPLMASTPISSSKSAQNCDELPKSLITENVDLHNQLTETVWHQEHSNGTSVLSSDESSLSTVDGIVPFVLDSDDAVLPENSRGRQHLCNMDQSSSSSGIGSLNCSLQSSANHSSKSEENDFSTSQPLSKTLLEHSRNEPDQSFSILQNSFDSSLSQKSEDLSCSSPGSSHNSVPNLSRTAPQTYPNSLMKSMQRNSALSSDSGTPASPPEKVVESWKASFSISDIHKPKVSDNNFKQDGCKEFISNWDCKASNNSMASMGLPSSFGTRTTMKRKSVDTSVKTRDLKDSLRECFSKKFTFEPVDWALPDPDSLFTSEPWKVQQFLRQKDRLNAVKDELNDLPLQDWHRHTRRRNIAGNIMWQLRNKIDPEFPTQAWCKFYENVSSFPLVPQKSIERKCLYSIHLCEAPGAFIASLNHFLHVNYSDDFKFDWRAVTLNPYYEGNPLSCMINDDRLLLKTLDKWLFGEDYTGDLMQPKNLKSIVQGASQLGEILLVTADGSIDCQEDPAEQEAIVSWLHYCETVAALQILAPGGSFLIKMFTLYEHFSIGLMYLLNCVFRKVHVNKPVTSKQGNSEVYVVCLDYRGAHAIEPWLDVLMKNYGPKAPFNTLFNMDDIPVSFFDQLYRCDDFFRKLQTRVIEENLRSFHHPAKQDNYLLAKLRNMVADEFFDRYKLKKLDRKYCLVDKRNINGISTPNIDPRQEEGSFNDRRKRLTLSPEEELKYLRDDLRHLAVAWPGDFEVFWMDFPENPQGFKIVRGRPITKVHSSKFCLGRLLKIRNRVREIVHQCHKDHISQEAISDSETRNIPWPDETDSPSKKKVLYLDFKSKLWASLEDGSNALHEKNACREILSVIENDIFRDYCLEIRGYPLLTQFNVGLVFLLGHLFEKIGFVRPKGQDIRIRFFNYRKFNNEMKRHWDDVVDGMENDSEAVLSVIQISQLSDGDFYKYVTEINNLCVLEQIEDLLTIMSAQNKN